MLRAHAPQAVRCADPFHVVAWATEALDEVRRAAWNRAPGRKKVGSPAHRTHARDATGVARSLKRSRWALWKNPDHLTEHQQHQLAWIAKTEPELWRAYLLKEGLRYVFAVKGDEGKQALDRWISWARRSRIEAFVRPPTTHRPLPRRDRSRARRRTLQRHRRIDQHQDPAPHPRRLRLPQTRSPHRPRHALPRRTPTPTPTMTHGHVTRARFRPVRGVIPPTFSLLGRDSRRPWHGFAPRPALDRALGQPTLVCGAPTRTTTS